EKAPFAEPAASRHYNFRLIGARSRNDGWRRAGLAGIGHHVEAARARNRMLRERPISWLAEITSCDRAFNNLRQRPISRTERSCSAARSLPTHPRVSSI